MVILACSCDRAPARRCRHISTPHASATTNSMHKQSNTHSLIGADMGIHTQTHRHACTYTCLAPDKGARTRLRPSGPWATPSSSVAAGSCLALRRGCFRLRRSAAASRLAHGPSRYRGAAPPRAAARLIGAGRWGPSCPPSQTVNTRLALNAIFDIHTPSSTYLTGLLADTAIQCALSTCIPYNVHNEYLSMLDMPETCSSSARGPHT